MKKRIGLTLGGGGARGLAHVPVLEVFDELGLRPYCITGTSIGAIIGALYASGHSAAEIKKMMSELMPGRPPSIKDLVRNRDSIKETLRTLKLIDPHVSFKPQGLLKGERFLEYLYEQLRVDAFEDLEIPLKVVATDFWGRREVAFERGELLPALRASMSIPYVFTPVAIEGRILVDGGLVNNLPVDLLPPECDVKVAVNVMGERSASPSKPPTPIEAIGLTYQVMMNAVANEKLKQYPVDVYVYPPLIDFEMLDFHRGEEIYRQGATVKEDFRRRLSALTEAD